MEESLIKAIKQMDMSRERKVNAILNIGKELCNYGEAERKELEANKILLDELIKNKEESAK